MIQKTKVLTLIVFGLLFLNLSAQDDFDNDPVAKLPDTDRKVRFGLQFSPNLSWLKTNTDGYDKNGNKSGFSYGLSFEYFLSNNYLISSGIQMLHSGGNIKYKGTTTGLPVTYPADVEASYNLRYIEIPFLLKLRTNEIGYYTYFGQFGFKTGFNYKSGADYKYTYQDPLQLLPQTHKQSFNDVGDDINFMNLYLVIGIGAEYNISGNTSLSLGITFNNGFVNQFDTKTHEIVNGDALIDATGTPVFTDKDVSANLNYLALNLAIYF